MKKESTPLSKVASLVITPLQGLRLEEVLEFKPILDLVRQEVPRSIERAIRGNKLEATVVEINNSGYFIELAPECWENALISCLNYYSSEEVEDFEKCLEIKKILALVSEFGKIPPGQRKKSKKR